MYVEGCRDGSAKATKSKCIGVEMQERQGTPTLHK